MWSSIEEIGVCIAFLFSYESYIEVAATCRPVAQHNPAFGSQGAGQAVPSCFQVQLFVKKLKKFDISKSSKSITYKYLKYL